MSIDLPIVWAIIIATGVLLYIIMDGFDLGIGVLFLVIKDRQKRDIMVNSVAPVWDGNETWLVLGGAGLMAAFPMAYAIILSALYLPLLLMLIGLIWRGVAFEFRIHSDKTHQAFWDKAFLAGSLLATLSQGVVLGSFIQGIKVENGFFAGSVWDWLTPFSLVCGFGLVITYALLGSTWLILKTEGSLYHQMCRISRPLTWGLLIMIAIISLWTPWLSSSIKERWLTYPNLLYFSPVPLLTLAAAWQLLKSVYRTPHGGPFILTLLLIFLGYSGLIISLWPNIIPPSITLAAASSPPQSQGFTLVGALLIIPIILVYTTWSYYVFRGKTTVDHTFY